MLVKIYTDGAARGNPDGPGGYGTILSYTDGNGVEHIREFSQGYVKTTNNRMELMAAIVGLEALIKPCEVELYSDSKYVVDAFNQNWMGFFSIIKFVVKIRFMVKIKIIVYGL